MFDNPFTSGEKFVTYSRDQSDFSIQSLEDEDKGKNEGFVSYRFV